MNTGLLLLAGIVLLLLAGVLPGAGAAGGDLSRSPLLGVLTAAAVAVMLFESRRFLRPPRRWGHLAAHAGIAVLLAGAVLDARLEVRGQLSLPVISGHAVRRLQAEGRVWELPFALEVAQVDVDYYPPEYMLYPAGRDQGSGPFRLSPRGTLDAGAGGVVGASKLRDAGGFWRPEVRRPDGSLLRLQPPVVRDYRAQLRLAGPGTDRREALLGVNRPLRHAGWLIHLAEVRDDAAPAAVALTLRRAPGRPLVVAGIWLALLGVAAACFGRAGNKERVA